MDESEAQSLEANRNSIEDLIGILEEAIDSEVGRSSDGWSSREIAHGND